MGQATSPYYGQDYYDDELDDDYYDDYGYEGQGEYEGDGIPM